MLVRIYLWLASPATKCTCMRVHGLCAWITTIMACLGSLSGAIDDERKVSLAAGGRHGDLRKGRGDDMVTGLAYSDHLRSAVCGIDADAGSDGTR